MENPFLEQASPLAQPPSGQALPAPAELTDGAADTVAGVTNPGMHHQGGAHGLAGPDAQTPDPVVGAPPRCDPSGMPLIP